MASSERLHTDQLQLAAQELTNANTAYSPIAGTTPTLYSQNTYTSTWLGQIAKANHALLSSLQLTHQHTLPIPLQSNTSLARLAELGARDPEIAWPVFLAFWTEITSASRPPILFALDGLSHIMKHSAYRSPEYELIHAHDLALVKHFVDYVSGAKTLPNGGAIVAAMTKSNNPLSYATELAITQRMERQAGKKEVTKMDPWAKTDLRAYESLQAASVMKLKGLSKAEARGLMEYWAASGLLRQRVDERTVTEKWALAGNGIVGEIERGALRMSI
jgi:small subunit ribosomal protein S29